jgi:hypothetical protein
VEVSLRYLGPFSFRYRPPPRVVPIGGYFR